MARNRFGRRLAARAELWRFTRRSVPRGVAVGLFVGIFLMVPGFQVIGAALLCMPFRANVPVAALATFVATPPTILFVFLPGAAWLGNRMGFHVDLATINSLIARGASIGEWLGWASGQAAPALLLGLGVMAVAAAAVGYASSAIIWRWWTGRKRRLRLREAECRVS